MQGSHACSSSFTYAQKYNLNSESESYIEATKYCMSFIQFCIYCKKRVFIMSQQPLLQRFQLSPHFFYFFLVLDEPICTKFMHFVCLIKLYHLVLSKVIFRINMSTCPLIWVRFQVWIDLLREMVLKLPNVPSLTSLRALCGEDAEQDFFKNIMHLQVSSLRHFA